MDRSDDVNFHKKFYRDGVRAFKRGKTLQANPWPGGTLAFKSWGAGWADAHQNDMANKETKA